MIVSLIFLNLFSLVKEGFFCQTTTSEERDLSRALAGQSEVLDEDVAEKSYVGDDVVDRYYSRSSQGSEDDTTRYGLVVFIFEILAQRRIWHKKKKIHLLSPYHHCELTESSILCLHAQLASHVPKHRPIQHIISTCVDKLLVSTELLL